MSGGGQLIHVLGPAWSGGYGVQRKVAGAEQALHTLPQKIGMGMMGLGGLIAVIGGIMFIPRLPEGDEGTATRMKQAHALWFLGGTSMLTLATVGWLAIASIRRASRPSRWKSRSDLLASRQPSPEAAQAGADALLAMTLPDLEGRPQSLAQWRQGAGDQLLGELGAPCVEGNAGAVASPCALCTMGVQFVGVGPTRRRTCGPSSETTPVTYPLLVGGADPGRRRGWW